MKVLVQDLVKRHKGVKEVELPTDTAIEFILDDDINIQCRIDPEEKGVRIYKISKSGSKDDRAKVTAISSNVIIIT